MPWRKSGKMLGTSGKRHSKVVLVADVGGTNTTFALVGQAQKKGREKRWEKGQEKYSLLWRQRYASKSITSFPHVVRKVLGEIEKKSGFSVTQACFAGAGPVSPDGKNIKITHLPWSIDAEKIQKVSGLACVLLINDFDAIAYGVDAIPKSTIVLVKEGQVVSDAPRALLGSGTGLGKSIIIFHEEKQTYVPISSEGGHASAALETEEEFALARFIQNNVPSNGKSSVIAWEDLVSGKGITNIYRFLEESFEGTLEETAGNRKREIRQASYDPAIIAQYKNSDPLCRKTFDLFVRFTARCAKNLALDALTRGGVYLAGGITAKNVEVFQRKVFKDEFIHTKKMKELLEQVPIYAIINYDVSLYGAARAALLCQSSNRKKR